MVNTPSSSNDTPQYPNFRWNDVEDDDREADSDYNLAGFFLKNPELHAKYSKKNADKLLRESINVYKKTGHQSSNDWNQDLEDVICPQIEDKYQLRIVSMMKDFYIHKKVNTIGKELRLDTEVSLEMLQKEFEKGLVSFLNRVPDRAQEYSKNIKGGVSDFVARDANIANVETEARESMVTYLQEYIEKNDITEMPKTHQILSEVDGIPGLKHDILCNIVMYLCAKNNDKRNELINEVRHSAQVQAALRSGISIMKERIDKRNANMEKYKKPIADVLLSNAPIVGRRK